MRKSLLTESISPVDISVMDLALAFIASCKTFSCPFFKINVTISCETEDKTGHTLRWVYRTNPR